MGDNKHEGQEAERAHRRRARWGDLVERLAPLAAGARLDDDARALMLRITDPDMARRILVALEAQHVCGALWPMPRYPRWKIGDLVDAARMLAARIIGTVSDYQHEAGRGLIDALAAVRQAEALLESARLHHELRCRAPAREQASTPHLKGGRWCHGHVNRKQADAMTPDERGAAMMARTICAWCWRSLEPDGSPRCTECDGVACPECGPLNDGYGYVQCGPCGIADGDAD